MWLFLKGMFPALILPAGCGKKFKNLNGAFSEARSGEFHAEQ